MKLHVISCVVSVITYTDSCDHKQSTYHAHALFIMNWKASYHDDQSCAYMQQKPEGQFSSILVPLTLGIACSPVALKSAASFKLLMREPPLELPLALDGSHGRS